MESGAFLGCAKGKQTAVLPEMEVNAHPYPWPPPRPNTDPFAATFASEPRNLVGASAFRPARKSKLPPQSCFLAHRRSSVSLFEYLGRGGKPTVARVNRISPAS